MLSHFFHFSVDYIVESGLLRSFSTVLSLCFPSLDCTDNNQYCRYWAGRGECTRNPRYMRVNCRKSCNVCVSAAESGGMLNGFRLFIDYSRVWVNLLRFRILAVAHSRKVRCKWPHKNRFNRSSLPFIVFICIVCANMPNENEKIHFGTNKVPLSESPPPSYEPLNRVFVFQMKWYEKSPWISSMS